MSIVVTLHVFSGRPNPTWELNEQQATQLAERLARISETTLQKPPGIVGGLLGYRGFSITAVRERLFDPYIYIHAGIVDFNRFAANRLAHDLSLEQWLLSTAGAAVEPRVGQYVAAVLTAPTPQQRAAVGAPAVAAAVPYDPSKWNTDSCVTKWNNCYNYANDKITNTFAQPGRASGAQWRTYDCADVGPAAVRDGEQPVAAPAPPAAGGWVIALVMNPGIDYHWYRLDDNNLWSQKNADALATNLDNSGRLIADPRTCDRAPYTQFCGFYFCDPTVARIG